MNTLKRIIPLNDIKKLDTIYLSYKYEDIKPEWIIHEGNLEYLYDQNIFKSPLFKKYFLVLTYTPNENLVILYLYTEKTKNPYKCFLLNQDDRLNDRCRKILTGKAGLFFLELIFKENDKSEIFGACSVPERSIWVKKFNEAILKLKPKQITRSVSDAQNFSPKFSQEENLSSVTNRPFHYVPFNCKWVSSTGNHVRLMVSFSLHNNDQTKKNIPANLLSNRPNCYSFAEGSNRDWESQESEYIEPKLILPEDIDENDEISSANFQTQLTTKTNDSQEIMFLWDEIYYNYENNNFINTLNNIGRTGVFLIRSSPKILCSNNDNYILYVYNNGHIHEFEINKLLNNQYELKNHRNEPKFMNIIQLCQYYTNHPLYITLENRSNKFVYLTLPYKHRNLLQSIYNN